MRKLKTLLVGLLLSFSAMQPVYAQQGHWPLLAQNTHISPGEASERVQERLGGRILATETIQRKGKTFYRIKLLTGRGVVKVIIFNASNGRFRVR